MECDHSPSGFIAAIYFVVFMCTVAFLILNLFIGALHSVANSIGCSIQRQFIMS